MAGGGIKISNIKVNGGADGATFVPSVDEQGNLSWSNNKGYTNPQTVNIKGPRGERGVQGIQGIQGERGFVGATGAKLVNRVLQGQDVFGGNVYLDTFDDGTTATFTAPKGEDGSGGGIGLIRGDLL